MGLEMGPAVRIGPVVGIGLFEGTGPVVSLTASNHSLLFRAKFRTFTAVKRSLLVTCMLKFV